MFVLAHTPACDLVYHPREGANMATISHDTIWRAKTMPEMAVSRVSDSGQADVSRCHDNVLSVSNQQINHAHILQHTSLRNYKQRRSDDGRHSAVRLWCKNNHRNGRCARLLPSPNHIPSTLLKMSRKKSPTCRSKSGLKPGLKQVLSQTELC